MNTTASIHPQFIAGIAAGLDYWQIQTEDFTDAALKRLDPQRQNLFRLVGYGLKLADTQRSAAVVALQAYHLVERRGYWQEWLPILQTAIDNCASDEPVLQAELLNRLGELYRTSRQLSAAIETHRQAEALIAHTDANHLRHRIWFNLSADYAQSRSYDLAEEFGRKALKGFREQGAPPKSHAAALNTLGMVAWWCGRLDEAEAQLRQAVALWRETEEVTELLRALSNLIGALRAAKKYEAIQACYEEAAVLFPDIAGAYEKTLIEINYGGALFEQKRYQEAEAIFLRANSPKLQQSNHYYYRATVAQCLGNTLLKQARLEEAESYLNESANLWAQCEDELMQANTLGTIAELYVNQGKGKEAAALFDEALALLAKYPDDAWARKLTADFEQQREAL